MNELIVKFMRSLEDNEKKKYFCMEPSEKTIGVPTPSPRSWEIVSNILDLSIDDITMFEMIKGAVGEEAAAKFVKFKNTEQGCSLKYFLSGKPVSLVTLSHNNIVQLCSEFRVLVDNDFKDYNLNDIYMRVGEFVMYISESPELIKIMFNMDSTIVDKPKLMAIFTKYSNETGINLEDKILRGVLL